MIAIQQQRHRTPLDLTYPAQYLWTRSGAQAFGNVDFLRPVFLPKALWAATTAMTLAAGSLLAIALVDAAKGLRRSDASIRLIAIYGVLYAPIIVVRSAQNAPVDHRHLLPLAVPLLVLALWHVRSLSFQNGRFAFAPAGMVCIFVGFSLLNANYFDSL